MTEEAYFDQVYDMACKHAKKHGVKVTFSHQGFEYAVEPLERVNIEIDPKLYAEIGVSDDK